MFNRVSFLLTVILVFCGTIHGGPKRVFAAQIKPGDKLVTSVQAPVHLGSKTLTTVPAGTHVIAKTVKGQWVGVMVEKEGKQIVGWIYIEHLAVAQSPGHGPWREQQLGQIHGRPVHIVRFATDHGCRVALVSRLDSEIYRHRGRPGRAAV